MKHPPSWYGVDRPPVTDSGVNVKKSRSRIMKPPCFYLPLTTSQLTVLGRYGDIFPANKEKPTCWVCTQEGTTRGPADTDSTRKQHRQPPPQQQTPYLLERPGVWLNFRTWLHSRYLLNIPVIKAVSSYAPGAKTERMAEFLTLPTELAMEIFSHLSFKDHVALCRVSRSMSYISQPLLYHFIAWTANATDTYGLFLLLRTLVECPHLAACVKRVHVRIGRPMALENRTPLPIGPHTWLRAVNDLGSSEFSERLAFTSVSTLSLDKVLTLLLSRLHHLRVLEVNYHFFEVCDTLGMLFKYVKTAPSNYAASRFRNLREVYIRNPIGYYGVHGNHNSSDPKIFQYVFAPCLELMMSLFYVPSLEILEMVMLGMELPPWQHCVDGEKPKLPKLHTLRLLNCELSSRSVGILLAASPNLRTLEYNFILNQIARRTDPTADYDIQDSNHQGEWEKLSSSLQLVAATLEDLTISTDYYNFSNHDVVTTSNRLLAVGDWERRGRLKSLKKFTKLKRLEVPPFVLLGWTPDFTRVRLHDALPTTLRELCLRDDLNEYPRYAWTPVHPDPQDWDFYNITDCTPLLIQLSDHLSNLKPRRQFSLATLCIKVRRRRYWRRDYIVRLEAKCRIGEVTLNFAEMRTNLDPVPGNEVDTNIVVENILYEPWLGGVGNGSVGRARVIYELTKTLPANLLWNHWRGCWNLSRHKMDNNII